MRLRIELIKDFKGIGKYEIENKFSKMVSNPGEILLFIHKKNRSKLSDGINDNFNLGSNFD